MGKRWYFLIVFNFAVIDVGVWFNNAISTNLAVSFNHGVRIDNGVMTYFYGGVYKGGLGINDGDAFLHEM